MKRSILPAIATLVLALTLPVAAFAADDAGTALAPGGAVGADDATVYTGEAALDLDLVCSSDSAEGLDVQAGGMTSAQRTAFNKLLAAQLPKLSKSIDVSKLKIVAQVNEKTKSITNGVAAIQEPLTDFLNANPDLFYVNNSMKFNAKKIGGKVYFSEVVPGYSYKASEIPAMKKKYEAQLKKIIASIPKGASQAQKAKVAHDWLIVNDDYNDSAAAKGEQAYGDLSPWNAYGALVKGKPVCEGISLGFIAVMKRLGISSSYVRQKDAKVNHAWNRVKVEGSWYNLDITYDENDTDAIAKKAKKAKKTVPEVRYFLKSDAWFKAHPDSNGAHKSWTPAGVAGKNTKYDKRLKPADWTAKKPKVEDEYEYTGAARVALNASASATRNYSVSGKAKATDPGTYKATAELDDDCFWDDGTISDLDIEWDIVKAENPMKVKAKSKAVAVKYSKTKNRTVARAKAFAFTKKAQGKVTFKKASGNKKITVSKAGKITVKKGLARGTYKVKVKVKAAGNAEFYKAKTVKVTLRIKVK